MSSGVQCAQATPGHKPRRTRCWTGVAVAVLENGRLIGRDPVNMVVRWRRTLWAITWLA
jgi:hypothetical protein